MKIRSISRRFSWISLVFFSDALIACVSVVSINWRRQKDKKTIKRQKNIRHTEGQTETRWKQIKINQKGILLL
jgi:hypothetical protein